jgi:cell division protein FtsB
MSTENEHVTKIATLEAEIQVLRAQNNALEDQVASLTSQLQVAQQIAEAAVRRERIMLANQPPPRTRRT